LDEKAAFQEIIFYEQVGKESLGPFSLEDIVKRKKIESPLFIHDEYLNSLIIVDEGQTLEEGFETFLSSPKQIEHLPYITLRKYLDELLS
jgi:hypothetical protein